MKKTLILLLLTMLVCVLSLTVAAETVASGECGVDGDNLTWTLDDQGTLTISGSGDMCTIFKSTAPWIGHTITSVIIKEGVTSISSHAFLKEDQNGEITTITVPSTLKTTGKASPYKSLYGYSNVTIIVDGNCTDAIGGLDYAKNVILTDKVTEIPESAFKSCNFRGTLTIGDNVKTIGDYAFDSACFSEIILGSGVETIGKQAFRYADITSIVIPEGVSLPDTASLFYCCFELESAVIRSAITQVGDAMFACCRKLASIDLPDTVTGIGKNAFYDCISLTEIKLPPALTTIADKAFNSCSGLTSITLPKSVQTFGAEVFCSTLTEIRFTGTLEEYLAIRFSRSDSSREYYAYSLYIKDTLVTELQIPSGTESICRGAFINCTSLTSVNIPATVKELGTSAFYGCTALESVQLVEGVETVGYSAFGTCTALKNITLPASVTKIDHYAFLGSGLETATVLSKNVEIGTEAFENIHICGYADSNIIEYAIDRNLSYSVINEDGSVTTPTKLAMPTNLSFLDENGNFTGTLHFDSSSGSNTYVIKCYVRNFLFSDFKRTSFGDSTVVTRVSVSAKHLWTKSGDYYFTVQAIGDGVAYSNSDVARSETVTYTLPDTQLATPTGLTWTENGGITFTAVENATQYMLTFYAITEEGYDALFSTCSTTATDRLPFLDWDVEYHMSKEGLDSVDIVYTATALSADIREYRDSAESDYSTPRTYTVEKPLGDVDGDGIITLADTLSALQSLLNGDIQHVPDMNEDGTIGLLDVLRLLKSVTK